MKHALASVACVLIVALVGIFAATLTTTQSAQAGVPICTIEQAGKSHLVKVVCVDSETGEPVEIDAINIVDDIINVVVDEVVTVVEEVTKTIKLPGPTKTVTQRPAPVVKTKFIEGPRETIFITETETAQIIGPTTTVSPSPRRVGVTETATEFVTAESSPTPTGQSGPDHGRIDGDEKKALDLGDGRITLTEAGVGLITILILMGLALLALYSGYVLGYKDKERKDTNFMRALLDASKLRR